MRPTNIETATFGGKIGKFSAGVLFRIGSKQATALGWRSSDMDIDVSVIPCPTPSRAGRWGPNDSIGSTGALPGRQASQSKQLA